MLILQLGHKMKNIFEALYYAREKYSDRIDDDGKNYFLAHILPVAQIVSSVTSDDDVIIAALLHDLIEDNNVTYEEIKDFFGSRVADLVNEVTHEGSKEKGYYFPRLHSKEAIMIKLADRLSNISRMNNWSAIRKEQYLKKTKFWETSL